ncbi:DUF2818 family protein [Brackiella oedipodis]|uniref:DUF2818 family protein n=1 Tax=Brackiella oedipodis TaxID=124225 RepID=UPI00048D0441|nr:DUF2818 family protein [Brackiella oedipodis]
MFSDTLIWGYLGVVWLTALLPFCCEFPLIFLPWRFSTRNQPALTQVLCVVQLIVLAGAAYVLINSTQWLWQVLAGILMVLLLALPKLLGFANGLHKSFAVRLVELLVLFFLVGSLGLAIERHYINATQQNWQFYAVALCLYLVMAYPGFVFRHLLKTRRNRVVDKT